jgi:Putative amidoligase enzyme
MYIMKLIEGIDGTKFTKKDELLLKDLLSVIPTLKRHKIHGEIDKKVRVLRNGRKSRAYTLELSRKFQGKEIKVSAPLPKISDKVSIMKDLKEQIKQQIRDARAKSRVQIEPFTFHQGVTVDKMAEVYMQPGTFLKLEEKQARLNMTKGKSPKSADNCIGIEIELASKKERNFICDKLWEAGLAKYVCVKDDGSIGSGTKLRDSHKYTHEITVLVKQSEYKEVIKKLCDVLNNECEVAVDKTCGLHVHIDMRTRDVAKSFHNLVTMQQFLYAMLPANRRNSRYSYPVKGSTFRRLPERYHGINTHAYDKFRTLELRMHCGTTQHKKINNWIELLLAMCDAPKTTFAPVKIAELREVITMSDELTEYVKSRIAKFKKQHAETVPTAEEPGTMPDIAELTEAVRADDTIAEQSEVA